MKSENQTAHLELLKGLQGCFPSDPATKRWRIFFILFGWLILPCVSIISVLEESPPSAVVLCIAAGILALGLVAGYIAWIGKNHHFQFKDGEIKSIGRRTLWRLRLKDIESIRIYKSGNFVIWWLKTQKTEKGLRLYPSLRMAMQKMIEQSGSPNPLQPSASGDR